MNKAMSYSQWIASPDPQYLLFGGRNGIIQYSHLRLMPFDTASALMEFLQLGVTVAGALYLFSAYIVSS